MTHPGKPSMVLAGWRWPDGRSSWPLRRVAATAGSLARVLVVGQLERGNRHGDGAREPPVS
jgi:hypothetical protein